MFCNNCSLYQIILVCLLDSSVEFPLILTFLDQVLLDGFLSIVCCMFCLGALYPLCI